MSAYANCFLAMTRNPKKRSKQKLIHEQANELYEYLGEGWKKLIMGKQWFEFEGVSSCWHFSSIAAHSSHDFARDHH